VPLIVSMFFGLDPMWSMLFVPFIAFLAGLGWACFGITIAGYANSIENFSYIISAVLTPLFLVAGTFFPLTGLPRWAQILGAVNPLHQCVVLVRHAAFGLIDWADLGRVAFLAGFAVLMWRFAIHAMERKLID
jgi:lipooligosaccharide transport system permease protein